MVELRLHKQILLQTLGVSKASHWLRGEIESFECLYDVSKELFLHVVILPKTLLFQQWDDLR